MKWARLATLAVLAALIGCACVTSSHPVGDEVPAIEISEWNGRWSFVGDSEKVFDIEVVDPSHGILSVTTFPCDASSPSVSTYLRGRGSDLFINLPTGRKPPAYFWFRIASQDDAIVLWRPDPSKFRGLVHDGVLPGRFNDGVVALDDLSAAQMALIASEDEGVLFDWKNPWVLHRVSR